MYIFQTWGGSGHIKETQSEICWEPWEIRSVCVCLCWFWYKQTHLETLSLFLTFLHSACNRSITITSCHQKCSRLSASCPKGSSATSPHGFHGYWCTLMLLCKSAPKKDCFTPTICPPTPSSSHMTPHSILCAQTHTSPLCVSRGNPWQCLVIAFVKPKLFFRGRCSAVERFVYFLSCFIYSFNFTHLWWGII